MAAGLVYAALGHDQISELGGIARALPMTMFAFGLGGLCLIGLPPTGGFLAKWLLLEATIATAQWWWAIVIVAGGLLTSAYIFIVLSRAMEPPSAPLTLHAAVPKYQEVAALGLALLSVSAGARGARSDRCIASWSSGGADGLAAMIEAYPLLAFALLFPLGMLLACLWPMALLRMPSYLAFAPIPAFVAVLLVSDDSPLVVGPARLHLTFALDLRGALLLGVAALLWIMAGAYASPYLQGRPNRGRFAVCWLTALTGCIGVFLAADMVGFYLFLAMLTLGACGLIIQHETADAWRAGALYIGLGLLAETLLLIAFVLLAIGYSRRWAVNRRCRCRTPDVAAPRPDHRPVDRRLWHEGRPCSVSRLDATGLCSRAGAGSRSAEWCSRQGKHPRNDPLSPLDTALPHAGTLLAAAGLFAALYGVVIGMTQRRPKVVLAYSSVSQMGFHRGRHRYGHDRRRWPRCTGGDLLFCEPRSGQSARCFSPSA